MPLSFLIRRSADLCVVGRRDIGRHRRDRLHLCDSQRRSREQQRGGGVVEGGVFHQWVPAGGGTMHACYLEITMGVLDPQSLEVTTRLLTSRFDITCLLEKVEDIPILFSIRNRLEEIGRASCRERVCQYVSISVVAVSLKTTTNKPYKQNEHNK